MQPPAVLDAKAGTDAYFGDPEWMSKTGMGGVLNAICLLLVGAFVQSIWFIPLALAISALVQGFLIRTAKVKQADPAARLPQWNEWSDLVFAGLTWVAIQFGWFVLAAIPITTALIMGAIGIAAYNTNLVAVTIFVATVGLTVLAVKLGLHFILSYLMINFAAEEKLSAGFNLARLVRMVFLNPRGLFTAWILAFQLQLFSAIIPSITILGLFIVPSTFFGAQLVGVTLMAQAWHAAAEREKYERLEKKTT